MIENLVDVKVSSFWGGLSDGEGIISETLEGLVREDRNGRQGRSLVHGSVYLRRARTLLDVLKRTENGHFGVEEIGIPSFRVC